MWKLKRCLSMILTTAISSSGVAAAGTFEELDDSGPAAAALLAGTAPGWVNASSVVKERAGFMIFSKDFPRKSESMTWWNALIGPP